MIGVPVLYASYALMRFTGSFWWLWLFGFLTVFQVAMLWAYPVLIMPRFNRFEPLPEGPLRDRLVALSEEAGFRNRGPLRDGRLAPLRHTRTRCSRACSGRASSSSTRWSSR